MLELWGGYECTVNRVGERYRDQSLETGHDGRRLEDLSLFAGLGIKALRFPVLWERVAPDPSTPPEWDASDAGLSALRRLGVQPIVGLLHHGSGPRHTSLVADTFVEAFARYARAVAKRYPWVDDWTPINEPLTTARFSALYGHWYPHATDERLFWLALLNQIDGIRAAMAEIRAVNPAARLIQTEDLGQTFSTPELAERAAFENARRWMSWDLLAGRVGADHPLAARLAGFGLADRLRAIADEPCPPDVVGVNHYPTSVRFLDQRAERYPNWSIASGGHADMDAVRILSPQPTDLKDLLQQAWDRYGLPLAVTESHNGCTREEQMRWTFEAWTSALDLRAQGVKVEAVTAWALLGNCDWDSLITVEAGHYEAGAFDIRGPAVRPTAMSDMLGRLGAGQSVAQIKLAHPALNNRGWWRRDIRFEHVPYSLDPTLHHVADADRLDGPPILIAGATGTLGRALAAACRLRGLPYVATERAELDLVDPQSVTAALERHAPWAVINAAGWVRVDEAEVNPGGCMAANAVGAGVLARACAAHDVLCVSLSSDLVFDGRAGRPYVESDRPSPLSVYGRSKAEAERLVAKAGGRQLLVRTAAFFSPDDPHNFAAYVVRELAVGRTIRASGHHVVTPTYTPDLANAVLDLLIDGETGVRHLSSGQTLSWRDFAFRIAAALDLDAALVVAASPEALGWRAERPFDATLGTERGFIMPGFGDALARFARALPLPVAAGLGGEPSEALDEV